VEETYGEDPYLTSAMGAAFVRPFEQLGIITTPKHFVANVGDGGRDSYPVHLDEAHLKNVHFPPFQACINAGSRSIMSSYNSLNGQPCSMNSELLNVVLKDHWKFQGFVISDAGAVGGANVLHNTSPDYPHSGRMAIENGLDVIFQTSIRHDVLFKSPFVDGAVRQSAVDSAVARVLRAKFELGLFENPYASFQELNKVPFQELSRQAAEQSMVLLKNERMVCPIAVSGKKILVVGEEAKLCRLGGYSGTGLDPISYWDGMQKQWKGEAELIYHPGWNEQAKWEEWNPGWDLKWWNDLDAKGDANWKEVRPSLNFKYTFTDPNDSIRRDFFSLKASTLIIPNDDRDFSIQISGNDGYKVWMNNALVIDHGEKISYHEDELYIHAQKNVPIALEIEYKESCGNPELHVLRKRDEKQSKLSSLREEAKSADYIIVFAGIKEGEFQDRSRLSLSPEVEDVLESLKDIQNPIIVALIGGSAVTMEKWKDDVDAIWMNWYGGEQQGEAFANLLSGKVDPSGRLPITFPVNEGQLPLSYWHEPTGRGDDYVDGSGLPLFPFGYGMSYAKFAWSDLMWEDEDHQTMSMTVKNISQRDGYEVVQLYMQTKNGTVLQPVIRLVGVQKLFLKPNQEHKVIFAVSDIARFLALSDVSSLNAQWAVGTSSRSLRSKLSAQ
jgi:beta-glucosidase